MSSLEQAISERITRYAMRNVALAAFSIFFTQSPSFLAHQRSTQLSKGRRDAGSIFGINDTPTDNHILSCLIR